MGSLQEKLEEYEKCDYYPFHMPGHKRNVQFMKMGNPYGLDITEVDGFDNLHMAEGILEEIQKKAAGIYGAGQSFLLINGSTAGILIAMAAATYHGDKVIVARNCHRAVYHGIQVNELKPVYLYPHTMEEMGISGRIYPEDVDKTLEEHTDAKMVIITSPTYEGIVSDVEAIAEIVHRHGRVLMVDEAHGAHFGFHSYFPQNSLKNGADLVIHSLHKTLPAFTQTGLLHVGRKAGTDDKNSGKLLRRVRIFFSIYQSSSPSYLLMAGIDKCLDLLLEPEELFGCWEKELNNFYGKTESLKHIKVMGRKNGLSNWKDPSKLIISVKSTNMTGGAFYGILRDRYHLQMEAECPDYVIGLTSFTDRREGYLRLIQALEEIDKGLVFLSGGEEVTGFPFFYQELTPYEAEKMEGQAVFLKESEGFISKEFVFLYPPGIPLIVPGERISKELEQMVSGYMGKGLTVKGFRDKTIKTIFVVAEKTTHSS